MSQRPEFIEQLRAESRGLPYRPAGKARHRPAPDADACHHLFTVCTGNRWMELGSREPEAKMLFGPLWYQNELCLLFADTNAGKSVLAVQIADSLSRCQTIGPFTNQAKAAKVLYIDFELSTTQFRVRYTSPAGDYNFADTFMRAEFRPDTEIAGNFTVSHEAVIAAIEYRIQTLCTTVLIIDNLTCLRSGSERATIALPLIQQLKALKIQHHLSVLVLAHTPKRRHPGRPISADDMQGSKFLINFADSAFAIGKSSAQPGLHYLKQIKQRNTAQMYGPANVCLCRIEKPASFLRFRFEGTGAEQQHLRSNNLAATGQQRNELSSQIASLTAEGLSQRQISRQLNIALGTVNKLIKQAG